MPKKLVSLATAAIAVALLAGCSSGGSPSGRSSDSSAAATPTATGTASAQSQQEACAQLEGEFRSFVASQTSASAPADPKARAAVVSELNERLDAALPDIGNATVKTAFSDFNAAAKDYASALTSSGSADSTEAKQAQSDVQSALREVSAACPA
ncbi:hypothetical protein EDF64_111105 [Curtobacterium flaccumfaciens]|uniref:Lipoprotein n=1 Tax=Curtobacterium flaccumfaciens TaxID=2035 RepID=A0A4R6DF52_9MICO|nr:hypothetical protein [Curtobacterium flaccumfaciens]TDN42628.1 hypothetical protein EDF64_111105 [Curtobacterium flaccumfaciens]